MGKKLILSLSAGEHAIARPTDVAAALAEVAPGANVQVTVRRAERQLTLQITPRAEP